MVRLNLSHGPSTSTWLVSNTSRSGRGRRVGKPIGVLADLPGPKIRAGRVPGRRASSWRPAARVRVEVGDGPSDAEVIRVDYPTLLDDLAVGDRLIIGDGAISSGVSTSRDRSAVAVVETGGRTQGCPGRAPALGALRLTTPTAEDLVLADDDGRGRRRVHRRVVRARAPPT